MKSSGCARYRGKRIAPPSEPMPERLPQALTEKITKRLNFYQDLGIQLFYRDRFSQELMAGESVAVVPQEITLPKPVPAEQAAKTSTALPIAPKLNVIAPPSPQLFEALNKVADDTL